MTTTITESKLKGGTLTLDTEAFACQAVNVKLTPNHETTTETDDQVETLCGATTEPSEEVTIRTTWTLGIEAIQDFTNPDGFVRFTIDRNQEVVDFTWKPNATGPTFSGRCRVLAVEIGGEINRRINTTAAFPVIGALDTGAVAQAAPFAVED